MSIGFWQIAIVVILVVLLFGRGKISDLMGDVAKGIKSFKKGMSDNSNPSNQDTSSSSNQDTSSSSNQDTSSSSNQDTSSKDKEDNSSNN